MQVRGAITVLRPREEVYAFWRDFRNLPRFMFHVESVEPVEDGRSHWAVKGPTGTVEWDAETTEERLNERIAWRSVDGSKVQHSGAVEFRDAPGERGTEIVVNLDYSPPGGPVGAIVAKVTGEEPRQQVKDDLRRFKQVMETGEVVRSDGTPEGPHTKRHLRQRPAYPLEQPVGELQGVGAR
jgi:uncharacterized membrane protein